MPLAFTTRLLSALIPRMATTKFPLAVKLSSDSNVYKTLECDLVLAIIMIIEITACNSSKCNSRISKEQGLVASSFCSGMAEGYQKSGIEVPHIDVPN